MFSLLRLYSITQSKRTCNLHDLQRQWQCLEIPVYWISLWDVRKLKYFIELLLLLCQTSWALSALFCIHELTDAHDWLVSLWLAGLERVWHPSCLKITASFLHLCKADDSFFTKQGFFIPHKTSKVNLNHALIWLSSITLTMLLGMWLFQPSSETWLQCPCSS